MNKHWEIGLVLSGGYSKGPWGGYVHAAVCAVHPDRDITKVAIRDTQYCEVIRNYGIVYEGTAPWSELAHIRKDAEQLIQEVKGELS